jgi:hypothetical protein
LNGDKPVTKTTVEQMKSKPVKKVDEDVPFDVNSDEDDMAYFAKLTDD